MAEEIIPGKRVRDIERKPYMEIVNQRTGEIVDYMTYNPELFKDEEEGLRFVEGLIKICMK